MSGAFASMSSTPAMPRCPNTSETPATPALDVALDDHVRLAAERRRGAVDRDRFGARRGGGPDELVVGEHEGLVAVRGEDASRLLALW